MRITGLQEQDRQKLLTQNTKNQKVEWKCPDPMMVVFEYDIPSQCLCGKVIEQNTGIKRTDDQWIQNRTEDAEYEYHLQLGGDHRVFAVDYDRSVFAT